MQLEVGSVVEGKVTGITKFGAFVELSMKKALPPAPRGPRPRAVSPGRPGGFEWQASRNSSGSFEDMMSKFKQASDEKMSDLKRSVDGKHGGGGFSRRGGSR